MKTWMLYYTAGSAAEAAAIGRALVRGRLAACVNILGGIRSIYRWKGRVEDGREAAAVAKTSGRRVAAAIAAIRKLHRYEVPCIVAWPLAKGHAPFLKWIADETGAAGR